MSTIIRLSITGRKHQRSYRVVAQDKLAKRDGRFLEILGFYNPNKKSPDNLKLELDKIKIWQKKGAQISDAVAELILKNKDGRIN